MSAILQTFDLTKSFGALAACREVSLTLRSGEVHALIGPNGAGKSTLIAQITGHLDPDRGRIELRGEDITDRPPHARARAGLARTFQISALALEHSVQQNALLGAVGATGGAFGMFRPVRDIDGRAAAALDRVGLAAVADIPVGALSHGQRRLLEVAIALTLAPCVFVMDEPMAGLDPDGARRLTGLLSELRNEAPILLVEHDMDAVFALADRISVLVEGRIVASGTPDEIRADADVRSAYLGEEA